MQDVAREAADGPAADLRAVIEESVAAHLIADVPVSSFLSGGLDSSIITVLAHQEATSVDAYTITFRPEDQKLEAMPDDAVYARKVARQFGIDLHEIEISPDIVDMLPEDGRHTGRADRRSSGHQHLPHVPGGTRARGQGHPLRDGCGRALRRLPQAPGVHGGEPLSPAAGRSSGFGERHRETPCRYPSGTAGCAIPAGPSAS